MRVSFKPQLGSCFCCIELNSPDADAKPTNKQYWVEVCHCDSCIKKTMSVRTPQKPTSHRRSQNILRSPVKPSTAVRLPETLHENT